MRTQDWIQQSIDTKQALLEPTLLAIFEQMVGDVIHALEQGKTVFFAGNGGSAADAQHLAAEFSVRYKANRKALAAIALGSNFSHMTAAANDFGYDQVFSRQLEAQGKEGDVLIALSTSGNSENILKALASARKNQVNTFLWTGKAGGKGKALAHRTLCIPSTEVPRIQECHMLLGHILCEFVDQHFSQ